jgi:hypothetical protein
LTKTFSLPNLKVLPYGGAGAVRDTAMLSYIRLLEPNLVPILDDADASNQFIAEYHSWISKNTLNEFKGLDQFTYGVYTNATTEAFDKFYMANNQRRFRCFRGEYMYHQLTWRNCWPNWKYIENDLDLDANDAVVISLPFADTGNPHSLHNDLLARCSELGIPVLLDCAYANLCSGIAFDLTYPCITDITFSLSKFAPLGAHARIGMRLTRTDNDDPLFVLNKTNYTNRFGAWLGLKIIRRFGPEYIVKNYRDKQIEFCNQLGAEPSASVIFGLGNEDYAQYNRGAGNNRLCFFKYLHNGKLPS